MLMWKYHLCRNYCKVHVEKGRWQRVCVP